MPSNSPVRVAIVGMGAISQLAHLPVVSMNRGAELVALCDNDGPKARALADRFGVRDVYTDIDDLFDAGQIDAVIIATPNHLHEPHVLAALRAGVDVLCERPLSLTSSGVARILTAAATAGRKVVVGNNHRFRSDVQQLQRFMRGGELGAITGIRGGHYQFRGPESGWRSRRPEAGGGAFLELGFPLLDLALWLTDFPDAVRVSAQFDRSARAGSVEDSMAVQIEFAGGVLFSSDVAWKYVGEDDRWWFEARASRGSARLAPLRVVKLLNGRPTDVSPRGAAARESAFIQSYRAEIAHFIAMLTGESPYEAPSDQLVVQKLVEAVYTSAVEGREIRS
ncbi:MAG: Gfo/Idh/MocA family oxidoreductase [Gemmatimonadota bacterium]|nr:Gfo/Idh/MocA family oxidoreductase [Gemmatimonadota bacterium]